MNQPSTSDAGTLNIKNNLLQKCGSGSAYGFVQLLTARVNSIDYNIYYDFADAGWFSDVDNVNRATFADHKAAISDDANSTDSDPLMVDPANGDFTLQLGSPAINTGVRLWTDCSDELAMGLDPDSTWPNDVRLICQDIFQEPEIGAFVSPYGAGNKIW